MSAHSLILDRVTGAVPSGQPQHWIDTLAEAGQALAERARASQQLWRARRASRRLRRALAQLDGATLRDLGLAHYRQLPPQDHRAGPVPRWQW